jgi:hypothetical protein
MTPKAIVDAIELRLGVTGAPVFLRDAIERELLEAGFSAALAAEKVEVLKPKVNAEIDRRREVCEACGRLAILHVRDDFSEIVSGSCYIYNDDYEDVKNTKIARSLSGDLYDHIVGLSFDNFESFGRSVLREIGCAKARVTPRAGDQGIDFYGELSVGEIINADYATVRLMHETRLKIVGQAKHYPDRQIGPSIVRELVGALSLARVGAFSKDGIEIFEGINISPFSPVLAMLFSTGEFTKGAVRLAEKAGIVVFSGWQLAVFLSDRRVGLENVEGGWRFNADQFADWLK